MIGPHCALGDLLWVVGRRLRQFLEPAVQGSHALPVEKGAEQIPHCDNLLVVTRFRTSRLTMRSAVRRLGCGARQFRCFLALVSAMPGLRLDVVTVAEGRRAARCEPLAR